MQINEFLKGIDADSDLSRITFQHYRTGKNIRILNKDGQGFVVTALDGLSLEFQLNPLKKPIGKIETQYGFSFIFSKDIISGQGEIGVYPAPASFVTNNPNATGFIKTYRPLKNLLNVLNQRIDCISSNFEFEYEDLIMGTYRVDSDNSINIYFADGKNVVRSLNCGFKLDGSMVDINRLFVKESSLKKLSSIFLDTDIPGKIDLNKVYSGGYHLAGNYVYYMRYVTKTYDRTPFKCQSGPIQIAASSTNTLIEKIQSYGREGGVETDKAISLHISGGYTPSQGNANIPLDKDYAYVEFAYCYNYENGGKRFELIDKLFKIDSDEIDVIILGNEKKIAISVDDIIFRHPEDRVAETIKMFRKKLFLANTSVEIPVYDINTRTGQTNEQFLIEFAKRIKISYCLPSEIPDNNVSLDQIVDMTNGVNMPGCIYKDYKNTYYAVGYFRGESYPFSIQYYLNNGQETAYYPMKGDDDWNAQTRGNFINYKGIYRFPNMYDYPYYGDEQSFDFLIPGGNQLRILAVKFDMTDAKNYLQTNQEAALFFEKYVSGYFFGRGNRSPNLIYQGLMVNAFSTEPFGSWPNNVPYEPWCNIPSYSGSQGNKTSFQPPASIPSNYPTNNTSGQRYAVSFEAINYAQMPDVASGGPNQVFFDVNQDIFHLRSAKIFPLYTRGAGFLDKTITYDSGNDYFEYDGALFFKPPHNYAAIPAVFKWKRTNDAGVSNDEIQRRFFVEQYLGLHGLYLDKNADEIYFPQTPHLEHRALFSHDYFFEKNLSDGNYTLMMWSILNFIDYQSQKNDNTNSHIDQADSAYDPKVRPYCFGAVANQSNYVKYPSNHPTLTNTRGDYVAWPVQAYSIYDSEVGVKNGFTSFFKEGNSEERDCLFHFETGNQFGATRSLSNRAFGIGRYIGLRFLNPYRRSNGQFVQRENVTNVKKNGQYGDYTAPNVPASGIFTYSTRYGNDLFNRLVSLYRRFPLTSFNDTNQTDLYDIRNDYDPGKLFYYRITPFIKFNTGSDIPTHHWATNGDCFIGTNSQKILTNPETGGIAPEDRGWRVGNTDKHKSVEKASFDHTSDYSDTIAGFGMTIVFPSENANNVAMRVKRNSPDSLFWNWDYSTNNFGNKVWDFYKYSIINNKKEEDYFNSGYNVVLGDIFGIGYEAFDAYKANNRGVRVRYSRPQVDGFFEDFNRLFNQDAFQDFDSQYGFIKSFARVANKLFIVQESAIVLLEIDERQTVPDSSGKKITLTEGAPLSKDYAILTDTYGTQHRTSIIETESQVYGVDLEKLKIWRIGAKGFELISDTKFFRSVMYQVSKDITLPPNIPIAYLKSFVYSGWNRKHNEVSFTFKLYYGDPFPNQKQLTKTILFSEWIDALISDDCSYNSSLYLTIDNEFFMCGDTFATSHLFYIEDEQVQKTEMFGAVKGASVSFSVNGPESINHIVKTFDHWEGIMNNIAPTSVEYRTLHQTAIQNPFISNAIIERYALPKYKEDRWYVPVRRASSTNNPSVADINSIMRGQYLWIKLSYNTNANFWIKSIFTEYKNSIR